MRGLLLDITPLRGREFRLLFAAPAAGSIVVAVSSGWSRHVHRHGRAVALAGCGWGLAIVGFGFTDALWLALLCLAAAGWMDAISACSAA